VPCDHHSAFRLTSDQLEEAITSRTRWLLINSPSNPSGAAYGADDYLSILEVIERNSHVWLMADDIYEHITYDNFKFVTPLSINPGLKERTLTINGVSKAYAMTGWRIGFGAGPLDLIRAMAVVQSQSTSCPSSISQAAATAALNGPQLFLKERQASFQSRRDLVVGALNSISGIECPIPRGAFYTFASCRGLLGKRTPDNIVVETDIIFAEYLLKSVGVAVVPGSAFGLSPYFRISFATSAEELREACGRIARACSQLR
jgi:aspartate aminotransferase